MVNKYAKFDQMKKFKGRRRKIEPTKTPVCRLFGYCEEFKNMSVCGTIHNVKWKRLLTGTLSVNNSLLT